MYSYILKNFNYLQRVIPLIDKWLIAQLVPPLIFSISAFTVVSLSVGVMFDLIRKIKGGTNCDISHLSISGITLREERAFLRT